MIRNRATQALTSEFARGLFWGAGLALAATLFIPEVRQRFRPLVVRAAGGVMSLRDDIVAQAAKLREDAQDMLEDARHERDESFGRPAIAAVDAVSNVGEPGG